MPNPETAVGEEASEARSTTGSSAQSSTIPEKEVVSAESVPVSDEPVVAVISEEASSVTQAEISPAQTPTDTGIIDVDLCLVLFLSLSPLFQSHKGFY